jgi:hypothetical protein
MAINGVDEKPAGREVEVWRPGTRFEFGSSKEAMHDGGCGSYLGTGS